MGIIYKKNKCNYELPDGSYVSDIWFNHMHPAFIRGYSRVYLQNKGYNFISMGGKILSKQWFDDAHFFNGSDAAAPIYINNKGWNYLKLTGELLSDTYFDSVCTFADGVGYIIKNDKYNYINMHGDIISPTWFKDACSFYYGYGMVLLNNNKWNYINNKGKLLLNINLDWCENFNEYICKEITHYIAKVFVKNKGYNCINHNGQFMFDVWSDILCLPIYTKASIMIKDNTYTFDDNFNIVYDKM